MATKYTNNEISFRRARDVALRKMPGATSTAVHNHRKNGFASWRRDSKNGR